MVTDERFGLEGFWVIFSALCFMVGSLVIWVDTQITKYPLLEPRVHASSLIVLLDGTVTYLGLATHGLFSRSFYSSDLSSDLH